MTYIPRWQIKCPINSNIKKAFSKQVTQLIWQRGKNWYLCWVNGSQNRAYNNQFKQIIRNLDVFCDKLGKLWANIISRVSYFIQQMNFYAYAAICVYITAHLLSKFSEWFFRNSLSMGLESLLFNNKYNGWSLVLGGLRT